MQHAINLTVSIILTLFGLVMQVISVIDGFFASLMTSAGVPTHLQVIVLVVAALVFVILAIRALGGVFGVLIVVLLLLLIAQALFPHLKVPNYHMPIGAAVPGKVQQ